LKEVATDQEKTFTFKIWNKKIMVVDRVVLGLNDYEKNQFVSSFCKELRDALLKVNACVLLLYRVVGEELLKDDMITVYNLKSELAEASSSLKNLKLENEKAKGEISSLRKLVEDLVVRTVSSKRGVQWPKIRRRLSLVEWKI